MNDYTTIWVLRPKDDRPNRGDRKADPWSPWYDKCFGMVVRAENEQQARTIANQEADCEAGIRGETRVWSDNKLVLCVPIDEYYPDNGDYTDDSILMKDVRHA